VFMPRSGLCRAWPTIADHAPRRFGKAASGPPACSARCVQLHPTCIPPNRCFGGRLDDRGSGANPLRHHVRFNHARFNSGPHRAEGNSIVRSEMAKVELRVHGRFLPGFAVPIENRPSSLFHTGKPVVRVWAATSSFFVPPSNRTARAHARQAADAEHVVAIGEEVLNVGTARCRAKRRASVVLSSNPLCSRTSLYIPRRS
jgi:hypothetical protein